MLSRTFTLSILPLAISALLLTACQKTEQKTDVAPAASATTNASAVTASAQSSVDLSKETAEYKAWVQTQIDSLLADTQKFVALLEAGKLEEAKALYPKVRMYYERSEPIAESLATLTRVSITVKPTLSPMKYGQASMRLKKSCGHKIPPKAPNNWVNN